MYRKFLKRWLDFIIVLCVLLVIWPILLVITIWLHFANKGAGAFFMQERPGKNGKIFKVIKFKSMTDERDENGNLLSDAQRLTPVGRFIRSTSLDELPQLINVLKGDMALIGPRPLLPRYLGYYTKRECLRHTVRPGITGWAQVNGRNMITWDEKLELDAWYVEHLSLWLDIKVILLTVKNVLKREGIKIMVKHNYLDEERKRNKKYLLSNSCLKIRPLELRDLEVRVSWIRDFRVYTSMNFTPGITLESTIKWFQNSQDNSTRRDMVLVKDETIIAFSGLTNINNGKAESYSFVNPNMQGQGYGTIARFLTCKYGFEMLDLQMIYSYCEETNIASYKVSEKLGYTYIRSELSIKNNGQKVVKRYYELYPENLVM